SVSWLAPALAVGLLLVSDRPTELVVARDLTVAHEVVATGAPGLAFLGAGAAFVLTVFWPSRAVLRAVARPGPRPPAKVLAGFGARATALIVDGLLLSTVPAALSLVTVAVAAPAVLHDRKVPAAVWALGGTGLIAGFALATFGSWVYHTVLIARSGRTLGKAMSGIRVVDGDTGGPVTLGRAFVRMLVAAVASSQVVYLGYLWVLWDDQKRTWHDLAASTVVVVAPVGDPAGMA
ncbi:MAG: RDD family protein, partial [Acidimicrobiales bacterium]